MIRQRLGVTVLAAGLLCTPILATSAPSGATTSQHLITASGQLAILNGLGTLDLHAIYPALGIPAPPGTMTLVVQSTFDPPGPTVLTVVFDCTRLTGAAGAEEFFASGTASDGHRYDVHLARGGPLGLWLFGWGTSGGGCGAGVPAYIPLIGVAAILP